MEASRESHVIKRLVMEGKPDEARNMLCEFLEKDPHDTELWAIAVSAQFAIQDEHPLNIIIEQCVSMLKAKYPYSKKIALPGRDGPPTVEEAIYRAVIGKGIGPDPIIIDAHTTANLRKATNQTLDYSIPSIPGLQKETYDSFVKANQTQHLFNSSLDLGRPYKLLSQEEWTEIEQYGWWGMFYRLYPNKSGILSLSAIGLNPQQNQALVDVGHTRNILMGRGAYYLLSLESDEWIVQRTKGTWIS